MDPDWRREMFNQANDFVEIMRAHDDEGIGARAQLDTRIWRIFNLFSCGSDYAVEQMITSLNAAKEALVKDREANFGGARRDLEGWHGQAADGFFNYLNQLEDGVNLMVDRIDSLVLILSAYKALVLRMHEDVNELVRNTLRGIADAESDGWKVGAAIVSAVVNVAGAAGGIAGGPTRSRTRRDCRELGVRRAAIETALRMLTSSVTDDKLPEVRPERPLIITSPDFRPSTFGLTDEEQGRHRRPTNTRDLVPEPTRHADGRFDRVSTGDGQSHDRYSEQGSA